MLWDAEVKEKHLNRTVQRVHVRKMKEQRSLMSLIERKGNWKHCMQFKAMFASVVLAQKFTM